MNVSKPPFDLLQRLVLPAVLSIAACSRVGAAGAPDRRDGLPGDDVDGHARGR